MQMGALVLKKTLVGAALEADVISLFVLKLSGLNQRAVLAKRCWLKPTEKVKS